MTSKCTKFKIKSRRLKRFQRQPDYDIGNTGNKIIYLFSQLNGVLQSKLNYKEIITAWIN